MHKDSKRLNRSVEKVDKREEKFGDSVEPWEQYLMKKWMNSDLEMVKEYEKQLGDQNPNSIGFQKTIKKFEKKIE